MKRYVIWPVAVGIGVVDAVLLVVFEFIGIDLTDWLWNDVLHTDTHRWLVVPVALLLGLAYSGVLVWLRAKRLEAPESDLLAEMGKGKATLRGIGVVVGVGATSLLAGASLGPEGPMMSASSAIGAYSSDKWRLDPAKRLLVLASVGALLVAFLGSAVMMMVPLVLIFQHAKKQGTALKQLLPQVGVVLLAGLTALGTLQIINMLTGKSGGYGSAPAMPKLQVHDFAVALLVGFVTALLAVCLNWLIKRLYAVANRLNAGKLPGGPWLLGAVFSLVLGSLYLLGGQTVQFSGETGSGLLVANAAHYGAVALFGLVTVKLLATAWSKGTGYRGGLVFPSIYVGVALGLFVGQIFTGLAGAGAMIGAIAGMLTAMLGAPVIAAIFLLAILPFKLWLVALCAVLGTLMFRVASKRLAYRRIAPKPQT